ncbi:response regulator [Massilia sp. W12]|uniref:ANTAR domain-containing response regulator n=1 Tax=Massilia sp. W12 TaxID=3126507 RepID=UPI0030CF6C6D
MSVDSESIAENAPSGATESSQLAAAEGGAALKRRILVVEDDEEIQAALRTVLEHGGFEVLQATSGEEGLRRAVVDVPDLAMLDIGLQGMSGLELAQQLQHESTVPFMFLTRHTDIEIVRQATRYGAVGYLIKPVDPLQIVPSVEAALARAEEILALKRKGEHLSTALENGRRTSMAVGVLMAKHQVDHPQAFEVLREYARSNRRKIIDVANDLLEAEKLINSFIPLFAARKKTYK